MTGLFPYLPVFLDLAGRAAVLLSGAPTLAPIARRLLDAGAGVTVLDPAPSAEMAVLGASLRLLERRWRASDFVGATLVVAGPGERRMARARLAARNAGALFIAHGADEATDVTFGAAAVEGPLAIGVTVSGLSPALGETMAQRLRSVVPAPYAAFLSAAAAMNDAVRRALPDAEVREGFWRLAARDAFDASPADWNSWIAARLDPD